MSSRGHVLVVGASSGIGRCLVDRLASTCAVTAVARREDRLNELKANGVTTLTADVANTAEIAGLDKMAVEANGLLNALVFCAGMQLIKPMRTLGVDEVEQLYRVNLVAPTMFAASFASTRVSAKDAVFCAISSIAAQRPEPAIAPYGASKAGLDALLKGLALEMAPRRVVGVAPGWLDTEMTQAYPHLYGGGFKEALAKRSPVGIATVDAVVDCIEFLISPKASFITGEIVRVDGGAAL